MPQSSTLQVVVSEQEDMSKNIAQDMSDTLKVSLVHQCTYPFPYTTSMSASTRMPNLYSTKDCIPDHRRLSDKFGSLWYGIEVFTAV